MPTSGRSACRASASNGPRKTGGGEDGAPSGENGGSRPRELKGGVGSGSGPLFKAATADRTSSTRRSVITHKVGISRGPAIRRTARLATTTHAAASAGHLQPAAPLFLLRSESGAQSVHDAKYLAGCRANESAGPIVFAGSDSREQEARSWESIPSILLSTPCFPASLSHPEASLPGLRHHDAHFDHHCQEAQNLQRPSSRRWKPISARSTKRALLNATEETRAGDARSATATRAARDRMVRANLRLVVNIARGYSGKGLGPAGPDRRRQPRPAPRRRRLRPRDGHAVQHVRQLLDQAVDQAGPDQHGQDDPHPGLHGRAALASGGGPPRGSPKSWAARRRRKKSPACSACRRRSCRSSRRRSRSTTPRRRPTRAKRAGRSATW